MTPYLLLVSKSIFCEKNNLMISPRGVKGSWLLFIRILQHEYDQELETGGGKTILKTEMA